MIKFSQEKVFLLHRLITEETGGDPNVRDLHLPDSALESAFLKYVLLMFLKTNGIKIHPSVEDVARVGLAVATGEIGYADLLA